MGSFIWRSSANSELRIPLKPNAGSEHSRSQQPKKDIENLGGHSKLPFWFRPAHAGGTKVRPAKLPTPDAAV